MEETTTQEVVLCAVCSEAIPMRPRHMWAYSPTPQNAPAMVPDAYVPSSGSYTGDQLCETCYDDRYFICDGCGDEMSTDEYGEEGQCHRCLHSDELDEDRLPEAEYGFTGYLGTMKGRIIKSSRPFGVEIECLSPDNSWFDSLPPKFGITTDGSVSGNGHAIEMVSPPLGGHTGEKVLRQALSLMNGGRVTVNSSCGFHVHFDGEGYRSHDADGFRNLRSLMLFYKEFDAVFRAMIPKNRRGSQYCRPTATYGTTIQAARTYAALERIWYSARSNADVEYAKRGSKYHESRYHAVNLHPLLSRQRPGIPLLGTIEVRLHSGTTNADKILRWVALHQKVLDTFTKKELSPKVLDFIRKEESLEHKLRCLKTVLKLNASEYEYIESRITKFANGN